MYRFLLSIVLLLFALPLAAQVKVAGKVTDETNLPLPGANILVHGTSKGVTTDLDGNYFIEVKKGDVLDFSYVGYKLQSRKVTGGGEKCYTQRDFKRRCSTTFRCRCRRLRHTEEREYRKFGKYR